VPGHGEGGKTHEGGGWVQREAHGVRKESGRGPQKKNKEITKSDPISFLHAKVPKEMDRYRDRI